MLLLLLLLSLSLLFLLIVVAVVIVSGNRDGVTKSLLLLLPMLLKINGKVAHASGCYQFLVFLFLISAFRTFILDSCFSIPSFMDIMVVLLHVATVATMLCW